MGNNSWIRNSRAWLTVSWTARITGLFSALGFIASGFWLLSYYARDNKVPVPGVNISAPDTLEAGELLIAGLFLLAGLMMLVGALRWKGRGAGVLIIISWFLMLGLTILSIMSYGFVFFWFLVMGFPAMFHGVVVSLDKLNN